MKLCVKQGVLEELQKGLNMGEQEFAEYIGVSRSQLWRAKLPIDDKRFSLGQDFIAKVLDKFPQKSFEDIFFLGKVSQGCDSVNSTKEVV